MPAAGPPIGMSFHVVIYGGAENRSVVGTRKKKNQTSLDRLNNCIFLSLSQEHRPRAHGQVPWLCCVDSSGEAVSL